MKKILIFGVSGFTGMHLWNYLKNIEKKEIVGTYHRSLTLEKRKFLKGCRLKRCDINDYRQVKKFLTEVKPQEIYFLPAIVTVFGSFTEAISIYNTNISGTAKFFEAVVACNLRPKILMAGSSEEYGRVKEKYLPIKEEYPLNPVNPYGLSKALQEQIAWYYMRNCKLKVNIARTFHFSGPLQPPTFVVSNFARQIIQVKSGLTKPVISVGNLDVRRDFTDIRDVAKAYRMIMKADKTGEVLNVCSNKSVSIKEILDKLIWKSGVSVIIKPDSGRLRKSEVTDVRGDNTKLIKLTGWQPEYTLEQTLSDILEWHRNEITKGAVKK